MVDSTYLHILLIIATAAIGCFAIVVSPDSITQSVPSSTALATSETSALDGLGFSYMEANISVATIANLPFWRHFVIMLF